MPRYGADNAADRVAARQGAEFQQQGLELFLYGLWAFVGQVVRRDIDERHGQLLARTGELDAVRGRSTTIARNFKEVKK